jgi:hypothetical protein
VAEGALRARYAAAALVAVGAVAAEVAAPAGSAGLAILDAVVAVSFALGAAAAAAASRRVADLALAVGTAWVLGTLTGLGDLSAYLAGAAVLLHRAPLARLLLLYPGRGARDLGTRAVSLAAFAAPFAPGGNGPEATAAALGLVAALALLGAARAPAALRAPRTAAGVSAVAVAITASLGAANAGDATQVLVAYELVLVAVAAVLLGSLALGRWSAAAASGLVIDLGAAPPGSPVTARLADALRDPSLTIRLRLDGGAWTDEAGRPVPDPGRTGPGRAVTRRVLGDGSEIALLHDPAAIPDPAATASAVAVAATAVENARRDREVRERVEELRRLRRGLLEAADEERRQLELELRSGPLRAADELDRRLAEIPGEDAAGLRRELAIARAEMRDIARGLHPGTLLERGLAGAVADAADRSPLPVSVDAAIDEAAIPPALALTAYYVVTEALANVARHGHADRARVELVSRDGDLLVRVADDGTGGADPRGGGLRGLSDRVHAVDGTFRLVSPAGGGTLVEARLPLG